LAWALPFLAVIGAHEIEVLPGGGDLGPEIGVAGESLAIKELVFDEAMNVCDLNTAEGQRQFKEHDLLNKTCKGCGQTVVETLEAIL
jgi:hypothetical protein